MNPMDSEVTIWKEVRGSVQYCTFSGIISKGEFIVLYK